MKTRYLSRNHSIREMNILLIGTGRMAYFYAEVLKNLDMPFVTIGRGIESAEIFEKKTGIKPLTGGLENLSKEIDWQTITHAIISVDVLSLYKITSLIIEMGVPNILAEKPGAIYSDEFKKLKELSKKYNSSLYIGYNRRFYPSVTKLLKLMNDDGGVKSFHFEFTEWSHLINMNKPKDLLNNWFLANSSHVVDLVFFICGKPRTMQSFVMDGNLDWHPVSIFSGAGITHKDALFSYNSNWESAGRWSIEICTNNGRYFLTPIEELWFQQKGQLIKERVFIEKSDFKAGVKEQVLSFLFKTNQDSLKSIDEQIYDIENIFFKVLKG